MQEPVRRQLALVPPTTGVYLLRDLHGNPLYIGKAVDLRRRVPQHFRDGRRWTRVMASAVEQVDWIETETELHALLLEDDLIKRHRPPHNRKQKKYTRQVFIELLEGGRRGARVNKTQGRFGPFSDIHYAGRIIDVLVSEFGVPRNSLQMGDHASAQRIGRFLEGYEDGLIRRMEDRMRRHADAQEFDQAARLRDRIVFCRRFLRRQDFLRQFSTCELLVRERCEPPQNYLFLRGELVGFWRGPQEHAPSQAAHDAGPLQKWALTDRAWWYIPG